MLIQLSDNNLPQLLQGSILVDRHGLPRYWAAIWLIIAAAQLAESTQVKKLRYIENLYQHADLLFGNSALDDALGNLDDNALAEILESWFVSIRNQANGTDSDEQRWQTGLDFVTSVVTWVSKSRVGSRLKHIEERLHRLSTLYSQLHVRRVKPIEAVRSLPANVVEALYKMLDPESTHNPFPRESTRWRVFVTFILMLHLGLRRGEVLLLPVDAIKNAYDKRHLREMYWLNVRENEYEDTVIDSRYSKPSIKTVNSIRQIPVSEATTAIVEAYAQNYRGRPQHSFLMNSQSNMPLSTEALTKMFFQISKKIPAPILKELKDRTGKETVTPHDLRHTCAVMRLNQLLQQGDSMDEALQKSRTFFGWSRTSSMPSRYARAVFEDRLAGVWNNAFDDRLSLLRALPQGH